tara:strand:+ start:548 stop:799 length:252 start_codon:yes stop_codon:yes gene_type:complete
MIRRILTGKKDIPIKLGRWGTNEAFLQTDLSNHDHCGSEICGKYFQKKSKEKNLDINTKKNKVKYKVDEIDENNIYYIPFTTF